MSAADAFSAANAAFVEEEYDEALRRLLLFVDVALCVLFTCVTCEPPLKVVAHREEYSCGLSV